MSEATTQKKLSEHIAWIPLAGLLDSNPWLPEAESVEGLYLPVFAEKVEGQSGIEFEFSEVLTVLAILRAYRENPPLIVMRVVRRYLRKVLECAAKGGEPDFEKFLRAAVFAAFEKDGSDAGLLSLQSAVEIIPESTLLKCDLVFFYWRRMWESSEVIRQELAGRIVEIFRKIDIDAIDRAMFDDCLSYSIIAMLVIEDYSGAEQSFADFGSLIENPQYAMSLEAMIGNRKVDLWENKQ